jgi:hypothetical protein
VGEDAEIEFGSPAKSGPGFGAAVEVLPDAILGSYPELTDVAGTHGRRRPPVRRGRADPRCPVSAGGATYQMTAIPAAVSTKAPTA